MSRISTSTKIYIALVLTLAVSNAIQVLLPSYRSMIPGDTAFPFPMPVVALVNFFIALFIYGGLGFLGLKVSERIGFTRIWDPGITNRQRFLIPVIIGILSGIFLIVADIIFSNYNGIGKFPHPGFPSSIFASLSAGIGEEIIFRLFFISFWTWLISNVILRKRYPNAVFWIMAVISAVAFAAGHIPSLTALYNISINDISPVLLIEGLLLNGVIAILAAYYLRKSGFLAAVGIHFWTDIVWHVIWGLF